MLALAWEIEDEGGTSWAAAARAFDWVQAAPASAAALTALAQSAFASDLPALGAASAMQLRTLEGERVEPLPAMETPFGPMSAEQAVLIDVSRLLLTDGRYEDVIERLRDAVHPSLRNNRALALFAKGDAAGALRDFEENWAAWPLNLFALGRVVRLRTWCHGRAHAAELAGPLSSAVPQRSEDALGQVTGLVLLGEWERAEASWQGAAGASYWHPEQQQTRAEFEYVGAVLALRMDKPNLARERARCAAAAGRQGTAMFDLERALAAASSAPTGCLAEVGEVGAWFPISWFNRLVGMSNTKGERELELRLRRHFDACDAHADYLGLAVELGGQGASMIAMHVLKSRTEQGDAAAKEQLVALLLRPFGPDSGRIELLNWLKQGELLGGDEAVPVLVNGQIETLTPRAFRLTPEPMGRAKYPPALQKRYEAMVGMVRQGRLPEALAEARDICRLAPEVPMSHANVAVNLEGMGEADGEAEALFRRALELDEDYLFARAGLARVLARRGDADAAKAMLAPVFGRAEYHYTEWRAILLAQREMALAQGESAIVESIENSIADLNDMERS